MAIQRVPMYPRCCALKHGEATLLPGGGKKTKKLDFLQIKVPASDAITYTVHTTLQGLLADVTGTQKPVWCPIELLHDAVPRQFRAKFYARNDSGLLCEREMVEAEVAGAVRASEILPGTATLGRPDPQRKGRYITESRACKVANCPDWMRDHKDKGPDKLRCGFSYDFFFRLALGGQEDHLRLPAFYTSTSFRSYKYINTALYDIAERTRYRQLEPLLRGLRVMFCLFTEAGQQYVQYRCSILHPGSDEELIDEANRLRERRGILLDGTDAPAALPAPTEDKALALLQQHAADPDEINRRLLEYTDADPAAITGDAAPAARRTLPEPEEAEAPPADEPADDLDLPPGKAPSLEDLKQYAADNGIPPAQVAKVAQWADGRGLKKGSAKRRKAMLAEMQAIATGGGETQGPPEETPPHDEDV